MNHSTSIGLDVHARSIAASALVHETGEVVRELTDQAQIEGAFESLSGENGLASEPEGDAEYAFELWQPETLKAGQDAADLDEVKVLEVTTYEGSPVV